MNPMVSTIMLVLIAVIAFSVVLNIGLPAVESTKTVSKISDADALGTSVICTDQNLDYDEVKRITVRVEWDSAVGPQEREVVSCLTRWTQ